MTGRLARALVVLCRPVGSVRSMPSARRIRREVERTLYRNEREIDAVLNKAIEEMLTAARLQGQIQRHRPGSESLPWRPE